MLRALLLSLFLLANGCADRPDCYRVCVMAVTKDSQTVQKQILRKGIKVYYKNGVDLKMSCTLEDKSYYFYFIKEEHSYWLEITEKEFNKDIKDYIITSRP